MNMISPSVSPHYISQTKRLCYFFLSQLKRKAHALAGNNEEIKKKLSIP
jgi:hypothetical protein